MRLIRPSLKGGMRNLRNILHKKLSNLQFLKKRNQNSGMWIFLRNIFHKKFLNLKSGIFSGIFFAEFAE